MALVEHAAYRVQRVSHKRCRMTAIERRPRGNRSAVTSDPVRHRVNGRTRAGRRIRDLYFGYLDRMGGPADPIAQSHALAAAELVAALADVRLAAANGSANLDAVIRLSNLANRAERRLGLRKVELPPRRGLSDYLKTLSRDA
jgi:hypothetical protein